MATKELLIVFVKNIKLGKVKTRLAKTIGDDAAFEVYKKLVAITEKATANVEVDKRIYFSDVIIESKWEGVPTCVQEGADLGERMQNAFNAAFADGYAKVILIGSDLPDMKEEILEEAFLSLEKSEVVLGPAEDGGYYLLGMQKDYNFIFEAMPWSKSNLLQITKAKLDAHQVGYSLLKTLNDIDNEDDLKASSFYTYLTQNILSLML
ncbi:MAG TPA: glycosyltransferase [Bacteroidetes bacterium]|nr:glycosyltransferase [Bacteroidota bacterium]